MLIISPHTICATETTTLDANTQRPAVNCHLPIFNEYSEWHFRSAFAYYLFKVLRSFLVLAASARDSSPSSMVPDGTLDRYHHQVPRRQIQFPIVCSDAIGFAPEVSYCGFISHSTACSEFDRLSSTSCPSSDLGLSSPVDISY